MVSGTIRHPNANSGNPIPLLFTAKEDIRKTSNVQIFPLPLSDSVDLQAIDILGAQRDISIDGTRPDDRDLNGNEVVSNITNLRNFANELQKILNGDQEISSTFHSGFLDADIKVKIIDLSFGFEEGSPGKISFSIKLTEASDLL
jgi:hypothetical protein